MTRLRNALAVPFVLGVVLSAGAASAQALGQAQPSAPQVGPSPKVEVGYAIGIVGALGGIALIVASTDAGETVCGPPGVCYDQTHVNAGLLAAGIGVVVVSVVVGALVAWPRPNAHLALEPLRTTAVNQSGAAPMDGLILHTQTQGAALTWHF